MISINEDQVMGELGKLVASFDKFPAAVANQALRGAMTRTLAGGKKVLKGLTPGGKSGRGRSKAGAKRSTGALKKAVATKVKARKGRSVTGVLGYRGGEQSRKAIWKEFGTSRGGKAVGMMAKAQAQYFPVALANLKKELIVGLQKAAAILARGPNLKNYRRKGAK
jgi:hypothetical protein